MSNTLIKNKITECMKNAMRAQDKPRLAAIRLIQAEIQRVAVDERIEVEDLRVLQILDKMVKQRRDSAQQFRDAARADLADKEEYEIAVIQEFLPSALTEGEIQALIEEAVIASGATSMQQMGAVIALVRPKVQGRGDMGLVSQMVKARLS